jgi:hypothetical protein
MSSTDRRWTGGRLKAGLLLTTAIVMATQGVVPVQAVPARAIAVAKSPKRELALAPKHKKAKRDKKKKKPKTIEGMIEREFGKHADDALRIAFCESRFDPNDVSSAGAVGVFQIRPPDHGWRVKKVKDGKDLFDPQTNVRVARHIFDHQGWRPWVCARIVGVGSRSGSYSVTSRTSSGRSSSSASRSSYRQHGSVTTWSPNEASRRPRAPRQPGDGTMTTWQ